MFETVLLFIIGLFFIIKGGDYFVDSAVGIAKRFGLSDIFIGATVISIGTTLPEIMVSTSSALIGFGDISYGNAIGSIICNSTLIASIAIFIKPMDVKKEDVFLPAVFFYIAAVYYGINAYYFQGFSIISGIILLLIFAAYVIVNINKSKSQKSEISPSENNKQKRFLPLIKDIILLAVGAGLLAFGSNLTVEHGKALAAYVGVPDSVIALTLIALGTSLPELVTAITSAIKGHGGISLGNLVGANLLNLVLVSGIPITLSPFGLPADKTFFGINESLIFDIPLMIVSMSALVLPSIVKKRTSVFQAIVLMGLYLLFLIIKFSS